MKKQLLNKWNFFIYFFALAVAGVPVSLKAQQRYFAVSFVNENDDPDLETIRKAKNAGFNALLLSVQWGSIEGKVSRILKEENGADYNVWKQYDDQIALARSMGMKIGLNIAVSTGDDATNSTTDRYGINTGDGWLREERILNVNYDGQEAVLQRYGGPIRPDLNLQFVMTSLAAQSTRNRIVNFTAEVIQRYKYLQDSGELLYVNLIFTRQGEGEFEIGTTKYDYEQEINMSSSLTDYSEPIINGFRNYLLHKYGNLNALNAAWGTDYSDINKINPKRPSGTTFTGLDGTDWFLFRTQLLKETNNLFKNTVKGINPDIKVISHHGSVYDRLSRGRGTLFFNEIAADLDGMKINDGEYYDSRFSMDLLRSNLPGKIIVNETAYMIGMENVIRQAQESFTHGAHVVAVMFFNSAIQSPGAESAFQSFASEWVENKQVSIPNPSASDDFTLSSMIARDGCATNKFNFSDDCDAYKKWQNAYSSSGNQPVNIYLKNDLKEVNLPVTLVNFTAKKQENNVSLNWQTAEESKSDYFEIQHSINGKQWEGIGKVTSSGESTTLKQYTFSDNSPAQNENLYRLKMVDTDKSFAFSSMISVKFDTNKEVVLFPNPVTNGVIRLKYAGLLPDVTLTDITARPIQVEAVQIAPGELVVKPRQKLNGGLYILTTGTGTQKVSHKLVISNTGD